MNNLKVSYFGKRKGIKVGFIISLCLLAFVVVCAVYAVYAVYVAYSSHALLSLQYGLWMALSLTAYGVLLIILLFFIKKNKSFYSIIIISLAFISIIIFTILLKLLSELMDYYDIELDNIELVCGILTGICMAIAALLISFRYRNLFLILGLLLLPNALLIFNFFVFFGNYFFGLFIINIPASICLLFLWLPIYLDNICICGFRNGKKTQFCGGCGKKLK